MQGELLRIFRDSFVETNYIFRWIFPTFPKPWEDSCVPIYFMHILICNISLRSCHVNIFRPKKLLSRNFRRAFANHFCRICMGLLIDPQCCRETSSDNPPRPPGIWQESGGPAAEPRSIPHRRCFAPEGQKPRGPLVCEPRGAPILHSGCKGCQIIGFTQEVNVAGTPWT